jgi:cytochrome c5
LRERIAIGITVLAVALLVGLSVVFAMTQNRGAEPTPEPAAPVAVEQQAVPAEARADSARGRAVFVAQTCERCHSVAGQGSPRSPLDRVGARRTPEELRAWTVAEPAVQDELAPAVVRAKQRYLEMPQEELTALLHYLATLR